jgi:3-phosphoinositide dependent protein kinase-1
VCNNSSDLWALGCILYKFFVGTTPFYENSEYLVFENVKKCHFQIPEVANLNIYEQSVPESAASLIRSWLVKDPSKRLGAGGMMSDNGYSAVKKHAFFSGVDFDNIFLSEAPNYESLKVTRYDAVKVQLSET